MENNYNITKICNTCFLDLSLDNFHKDKDKKDGHRNRCKECQSKYIKNYYIENTDKVKEIQKTWRKNNMESILIKNKKWKENNIERHKEICKNSVKKNKDRINKYRREYEKNRKKNDAVFKLRCYLSRTISDTLREKKFSKQSKTNEILGCSFEEFKEYLETLWEPWMNWDNYGNPKDGIFELNKTWDIDHIIPSSSALTEDDIIKLNHYTNLQPLCSFYNRKIKKDKLL
jgi:hypothetical protein